MTTQSIRHALQACAAIVLSLTLTASIYATPGGHGESSGGTGRVGENQGGSSGGSGDTASGSSSGGSNVDNQPSSGGSDWTTWIPKGEDYETAKRLYEENKELIPDRYRDQIEAAMGAKDAWEKAKQTFTDVFSGSDGKPTPAETKKLKEQLVGAQNRYKIAQQESFKLSSQKNALVGLIRDMNKALQSETPMKVDGKVVTPTMVAEKRSQYMKVKSRLDEYQKQINDNYKVIKDLKAKLGLN